MALTREFWEGIDTLEKAKKHLYTFPSHFKPDVALDDPLLNRPSVHQILEFGAGIGKNIPILLLLPNKPIVYVYELPGMTLAAWEYLGAETANRAIWISPPANNLRFYKFDRIIASYVFQHIGEFELRQILFYLNEALADHGLMRVISRWYLDDEKKGVWPIILDYFEPVRPVDLAACEGENHQTLVLKKKLIQ